MNEGRKLKEWFREDSRRLHIDQERKNETLKGLRCAVEEVRIIPQVRGFQLLRTQLRFMEKRTVLIQFAAIMILLAVYPAIQGEMREMGLCWFGAVSSALFGVFVSIACFQEELHGIAELAASCVFRNRQLCVLRFVLHGGLSLLFLSVFWCFLSRDAGYGVLEIGCYLLVPYFATGCVQFALLLLPFVQRSRFLQAAAGVFLVLACAVTGSFPELYMPGAAWVWAVALAVSGGVYMLEFAWFLCRADHVALSHIGMEG